ncbi:hypothetical protein lerEdw1_005347 [Lerista edwardsae]|nr:hypothetical protein lerEdw1_005347 [Lerista edwardsae]
MIKKCGHLHDGDIAMLRDLMGKTFRLFGYTIQYGCIAHCAFEYLGGIVVCSGPSMEPTIQNSDIVFSETLSCHFYSIQKGDIVIAKNPSDPKSNICKRVMGLEGDKICTSSPSDFHKIHSYVPKGHVWLEGDNLRNSTDSRCYGPVPYGLIKGRICFKVHFCNLKFTRFNCNWVKQEQISNAVTNSFYFTLQLWPLNDFGFLRASPNSHRICND